MHPWQTAAAIFFVYIGTLAAFHPRVPTRRRALALCGSAIGLGGVIVSSVASNSLLDDWVLPPVLLLMGYWTSGLLFVSPMPRAEQALQRVDRQLRIRQAVQASPRALAEFLEIAYLAVYPMIPLALVLYLTTTAEPDAASFWTVILVTDFICFGMLPWVQTRPPRALDADAWTSRVRALNVRVLWKTSIQANTFPSGHAAEALAAALLAARAPAPIAAAMFALALAVAAGAVLGRYHYAADAIAGWAVALLVWAFVMYG
jgi:membrane-associated phospholipid phosphatase